MSDITLADCRVMGGWKRDGVIHWPLIRPMTEADLDALIRQRFDQYREAALTARAPSDGEEE